MDNDIKYQGLTTDVSVRNSTPGIAAPAEPPALPGTRSLELPVLCSYLKGSGGSFEGGAQVDLLRYCWRTSGCPCSAGDSCTLHT